MNKDIKMVDLSAQHRVIEDELEEKWKSICKKNSFILGEEVSKFESEFAAYCGCRYAVAVSSGTSALHLALEALDCKGREVITVPFTFIATAEAVIHSGGSLSWSDICADSFCIDTDRVKENINEKTCAILPVHLYGHPADMESIMNIAKENNLRVVEDCAQAHGAKYKGSSCGSFGDAGCFSFYPGKNLGAYGDAGAIVTNDKNICELIRRLRTHGSARKYHHTEIGYNYRMDALQAAVLRIKLKYLDEWNEKRKKIASIYSSELEGLPVELPPASEDIEHVYHQYVILSDKRDMLMKELSEKSIASAIHYPIPLHMQPSFEFLNFQKDDFPVSERVSEKCLSLPMHPYLNEEEIARVIDAVRGFYE